MKVSRKVNKSNRIQTGFISVIVGISLVLFMLGLVIGAFFGLENLQRSAKENIEVDIFFSPTLNNADIKLIEQELKQWPQIKSVWFVSPERALDVFSGDSSQINEIMEIYNGESPFPPSVTFNPINNHATAYSLAKIKDSLLAVYPNQIAEVNYDENRINEVNLGFLQWVYLFIAVGILLAIIAFAIINNTIRLALYSKRFIIKTQQLVGAKAGFIRKPFLWNSIVQGVISAIIGMTMLMTVFYALNNYMPDLAFVYDIKLFLMVFVALVFIGVFISLISTWLALNKYLRKKLNDLY
jgi:cell division transport system permease protein